VVAPSGFIILIGKYPVKEIKMLSPDLLLASLKVKAPFSELTTAHGDRKFWMVAKGRGSLVWAEMMVIVCAFAVNAVDIMSIRVCQNIYKTVIYFTELNKNLMIEA